MELLLNLSWLLLALTSCAILGRRVFRADDSMRPGVPKWHFVVALGLSLVILFFVISMTDDLHEQQVIAEESGSTRMLPETGCPDSNGKHFVNPGFSRVIIPEIFEYSVVSLYFGCVEVSCRLKGSLFECVPPAGRAPPPPTV
jgi:hypothetical protein